MEPIRLDEASAWEVTTAHGTRIILDLTQRRWMRLPAFREDGTLNLTQGDGLWRSLAYVHPAGAGEYDGPRAVIGHRLLVAIGARDWWETTAVVSVRRLDPGEFPRSIYGE